MGFRESNDTHAQRLIGFGIEDLQLIHPFANCSTTP